jgi:peptidoglycan/xylan/chitin deacetylase (PgdA/CDA1 family)
MVLAYQQLGWPEDLPQRTPDNFRGDLERLLAEGYYPVNLRDLASGNLAMVPPGKRPLVLTFDGSDISQFRLLPDGSVDPDSAVGILLAFHQVHPADWPLRATFFVLQAGDQPDRILFGQPDLAQQKLQLLVNWGMEVGSQTLSHANLADSAAEEVSRQLALSQANLQALLPGYEVVSLSLPFGAYPADETQLVQGQYGDIAYHYQAVVAANGGLTPSPRSADFNPYHILRIQASQAELDHWLAQAAQPGVYYVSPGE